MDMRRAAHYFTLSANQGHPLGQCNYGLCFLNGDGISINLCRALPYFKLSVYPGHHSGHHKDIGGVSIFSAMLSGLLRQALHGCNRMELALLKIYRKPLDFIQNRRLCHRSGLPVVGGVTGMGSVSYSIPHERLNSPREWRI
jgi:TPR repeat protein